MALGNFARDDGDAAFSGDFRHGLSRVVDEIDQGAFDLLAVDHHAGKSWIEPWNELDAVQALIV